MTETEHPFIQLLKRNARDQEGCDPGVLADLRRGLMAPPGASPQMYPHILPFLSETEQKYQFEIYCLLGSLFALHPLAGEEGNMGNHLRQAGEDSLEAAEKRFVALLRSRGDDLQTPLRQAVSQLKQKNIRIHWEQLRKDLINWDNESRFVQKQWAQGFWGYRKEENEENNTHPINS